MGSSGGVETKQNSTTLHQPCLPPHRKLCGRRRPQLAPMGWLEPVPVIGFPVWGDVRGGSTTFRHGRLGAGRLGAGRLGAADKTPGLLGAWIFRRRDF